jgi:uncharacterized protein (DUF58 family)
MPLFDADFLNQLEYLSLLARRAFRGQWLAQRRARQAGSGIEFADHREYTRGDDLRSLDWNVYARLNLLLLKRFQEERDLHVYFLLDASRSMGFGTPPKFVLGWKVAAALAYIALAGLDRVAVLAGGAERLHEFPLTRGKGRILSLLRFLEGVQPDGRQSDLAGLATAFVRRRQRPGLVVLVSDLFDPAGFESGLDILRHHRYEPQVTHVYDRREAEPTMLGDVELLDIETETAQIVTVSEQSLRRYRQIFQDFLESARTYCLRYSLGYVRATSDVPFQVVIQRVLRAAAARGVPGGVV